MGELRVLLKEAPRRAYFHVSEVDHGDSFVLTPRVPRDALDLQEEDFTTPRVCLAPTVESAIEALGFSEDEFGMRQKPTLFVYQVESNVDVIVPRSGEVPLSVYDLPKNERAAALKGWVPDADQTGEVWSLEPVRVKKVRVLAEGWSGSRPEESYDSKLIDDETLKKKSVYVPDDVKASISKWMKAMGLA